MPNRRRIAIPDLVGHGRPALCFSGALLLLLAARPAAADTYTVDRLDDSTAQTCSALPNNCALRGAILKANGHTGADEIVLRAGTYSLTIAGAGENLGATGDLDVTEELLIRGVGPELTIIDGGGLDRVFDAQIPPVARLTLRGLSVTGGECAPSEGGGGLRSQGGGLRLETVWVVGNLCAAGGGGISTDSCTGGQRLEVVDSWIGGNEALLYGGIYAGCALYLERSTVSGNTADYSVGGIGLITVGNSLLHSTITLNATTEAGYPGGIRVLPAKDVTIDACTINGNSGFGLEVMSGGAAELANTLIAGGCGGPVAPATIGGNLESPGHTCGLGASDLEDVADPGLSALGWWGGPSPVYRPTAGSPLIDQPIAGPNGSLLDQRHAPRPRDGDDSEGAQHDIGAVELWSPGEIFLDGFECGFTTAWSLVAP